MKSGLNNINNVDMTLQICDTLIWKKVSKFCFIHWNKIHYVRTHRLFVVFVILQEALVR